ncbi:hypothetical protein TIFTF001_024071 [Ficus carica]|uniref:SWIM-type domain-containing protein n=1 Tax=Ficus carica TaxID=3494 RepID=A0AA88DGN6_FICCA|nr:hypothetical protein TIFTF001_024071 [Ficus carica]
MSKSMIGMNQIYIVVEYNGKWENVDGRFWRWFGAGISKGFVVDRSIKFLELEETIYNKTSIDRSMYAIEITHKPVGDIFGDTTSPTLICNDSDIIDLMFFYNEKRGMTLHVTKIEKCDKGKAICVRGDDDMNGNGGYALGFHDDYFGCQINKEISFVARFIPTELVGNYEHPLQICATSTPINEGITGFNPTPITGSNPTPEETVLGEVANEDCGVDNGGDDVSEGGDDSRKEDDGVPEKDDRRWQQAESEDTRFVPLISSNSGRNDGSDLMVGQHFESNEELNTKLNLVAIEGKFEMKVKKSNKSLKEVVCVEEPNCLWRVRATKMPVTTLITPKREEILRRRFDEAGSLTPYQLNENEYTVIGGDCNACVNLTTRSCTCRVFDIDKIPCIHAIAAAETIYPVPSESQWHNIPEEVRAIKVAAPNV